MKKYYFGEDRIFREELRLRPRSTEAPTAQDWKCNVYGEWIRTTLINITRTEARRRCRKEQGLSAVMWHVEKTPSWWKRRTVSDRLLVGDHITFSLGRVAFRSALTDNNMQSFHEWKPLMQFWLTLFTVQIFHWCWQEMGQHYWQTKSIS